MNRLFVSMARHAGWIAALSCVVAAAVFSAGLEEYSHARHPLALLGARGAPQLLPHPLMFNLFAFLIPGLLVAVVAIGLRAGMAGDASWSARIGARVLLLSALAFAAQGLLTLDLNDLDGPASRLHATVWMLWWIAFVAGTVLLAIGLPRSPPWRGLAFAAMVAAGLVVVFALFAPQGLPAGVAQRIAFAAWFAWMIAAGFCSSEPRSER